MKHDVGATIGELLSVFGGLLGNWFLVTHEHERELIWPKQVDIAALPPYLVRSTRKPSACLQADGFLVLRTRYGGSAAMSTCFGQMSSRSCSCVTKNQLPKSPPNTLNSSPMVAPTSCFIPACTYASLNTCRSFGV